MTWPQLLNPLPLERAVVPRLQSEAVPESWIADRMADERTRVMVVDRRGRIAVVGEQLVLVPPSEAPAPGSAGLRLALGVDDDDVGYVAVVTDDLTADLTADLAADLTAELPGALGKVGATAVPLRDVGDRLDARDVGLAVHAVGLAGWHADHGFAPDTGHRTVAAGGGGHRVDDVTARVHYPRTDPAVIMLVLDEQDRALLGHQVSWPQGRFSTLAGFVETGESLEQAVRREVLEEAGVVVTETRYAGSQAWPFPRSLMLGFYARAQGVDPTPDGAEIGTARWFTREELAEEVAAGTIGLPGRVSIARALIEGWYGSVLDGAGWLRPASP